MHHDRSEEKGHDSMATTLSSSWARGCRLPMGDHSRHSKKTSRTIDIRQGTRRGIVPLSSTVAYSIALLDPLRIISRQEGRTLDQPRLPTIASDVRGNWHGEISHPSKCTKAFKIANHHALVVPFTNGYLHHEIIPRPDSCPACEACGSQRSQGGNAPDTTLHLPRSDEILTQNINGRCESRTVISLPLCTPQVRLSFMKQGKSCHTLLSA